MKYKRYPKYKNSGVEWIGKIPEGWEVKKLFVVLTKKDKKNNDDVERKMLSVSQTLGIIEKKYDSEIQMRTQEESSTYRVVEPGDLAVNNMWIQYRGLGVSSISGIVSPAYYVYKINSEKISPNFLNFLVRSDLYVNEYRRWLKGIRPNSLQISSYNFTRLPLVLPSRREQEQIYDFLQNVTTQIDELIAKSKAQVTLLAEKRQATITQAVTKGLDPSVPMKDSGVDWIGEIPKHWLRGLLKYFVRNVTDGAHISPDLSSPDKFFVSTVDIDKGVIDFDNCLKTSCKSYEYLVQTGCKPNKNDILFSKDGTIGKTSIVRDDDFVVASSLIIIKPNFDKVTSDYLNFVLQSSYVLNQVESMVRGAALLRVSLKNIKSVGVVLPPFSEQKQIAEFLDKHTAQLDELISKSKSQIILLQEKRQALITATITGKIDVRGAMA